MKVGGRVAWWRGRSELRSPYLRLRRVLVVSVVVMTGLAGSVRGGPLPPPQVRPGQRTLDCTTNGCHAEQTTFKVVHNPVAQGSCESCHKYTDESKHTFKLRTQGGELCTFCHIGGGGAVGPVSHQPFARGECLSCHKPHGGGDKFMLKAESAAALCASCHGDITKHKQYLHGPVTTGSCVACHSPHRSAAPKLLAASGRELCLSCHDKMNTQLEHASLVHKPVSGDCRQCHEVHASDHKKQLKEEPEKLCLSCHEKVKTQIATAVVAHSAVTRDDACLNCHTPHGGTLSKLMKAEPAEACLKCHDKSIKVAGGRVVASMAAVQNPSQFKHGPLREGDCAGCHIAHGSPEPHLLAKTYSSAFYQSFSLDKYELCFSCHNRDLVLLKNTTGLTGFRNGDVNLHYLHVNKSEKGRNCRACHETHTSSLPLHLREKVAFGGWELPIGYRQTPNGGACASACHKEYQYDRVSPVANPVPKLVSQP